MSYQLETNTDSSKIIHLNSLHANHRFTSGLTSYCEFHLDTPIEIDEDKAALISLNSAVIPYSFYNIREGINDSIAIQVTNISTVGLTSPYLYITIPKGNYTVSTLKKTLEDVFAADTWVNNGVENPAVGQVGHKSILSNTNYGAPIKIEYERHTMKFKFKLSVAPQVGTQPSFFFDFSAPNIKGKTAHVELGFNELASSSVFRHTDNTAESINVPDVNGSVHTIFIRTNLTSQSSIDSFTKSFSTILGKMPIQSNFGSILFYNPRDNLHRVMLDTHIISSIVIRVTDEENRLVDLNGLHFNASIMIDIVNKTKKQIKETRRIKELEELKRLNEERILYVKKQNQEKRGRPRKPGRPKNKVNLEEEN